MISNLTFSPTETTFCVKSSSLKYKPHTIYYHKHSSRPRPQNGMDSINKNLMILSGQNPVPNLFQIMSFFHK